MSALFMVQEQTASLEIQNLEEAIAFAEDPKNKYKGLKFETILQVAEEMNQNKRIYRRKALQEGLRAVEPLIQKGHLWMEAGHPITDNPKRFASIVMGNSVSRIVDYKWQGNTVKGVLETLNNTAGKDLKGILLQGVRPGVSLRALGSASRDPKTGAALIENRLKVITYDVVLNPSHKTALVERILTESQFHDFFLNESENYEMFSEATDREGLEYIKPSEVQYDLKENTAIICNNGSCTRVILEDHIKEAFKSTFKSLIG